MFWPWPALMPLETIVLRVFLPMWIILVPVSACWRWLVKRHGIKFADAVVALQDAAWIFPGDGRAGLDLRPTDLAGSAAAVPALGHEIVNPALAFLVAGIPVLHGAIFDLRIIQRHQFHDGRVKLILIAHRGGAALRDNSRTPLHRR